MTKKKRQTTHWHKEKKTKRQTTVEQHEPH